MGIPPDIIYGLDCLACHPLGKTPLTVFIEFSGIKKGATWVPGLGEPPNETWYLLQGGACGWGLVMEGKIFSYRAAPVFSLISCVIAPGKDPFIGFQQPICVRFSDNTIVAPAGVAFYGGTALVTWV